MLVRQGLRIHVVNHQPCEVMSKCTWLYSTH